MRVGLIARSNARGLGSQTYEAWRGYPFDSVLHLLDDQPRWPERPDLYPGAHIVHWEPGKWLEEDSVREFMSNIDVIFSVETMYDWSLVKMAKARGIRTIVQANPEFMRHERHDWAETPHPTIWCFPTPWLIEAMPSQRILPVPVPVHAPYVAGDIDADRLTVLHVAGHRAAGDRNGTEFVLEAMRLLKTPVLVRIIGQDGPNTIFRDKPVIHPRNVEVELIESGVEDRWDLYKGAHIVLLPRRYGGLCLPAIEAVAAGVVPFMPSCSPNTIWPIEPVSFARGRSQLTPFGHVETAVTNVLNMAHRVDDYNRDRELFVYKRKEMSEWAAQNTWERLGPLYTEIFHSRP